jgi:hypothetical protein
MTFMLMKSRMKINPGYACTSLHIFMIKFYTEYIHTTGRSPVRKCALAHHHRGTVSAISTKSCDESAQGPIIYVRGPDSHHCRLSAYDMNILC